MRFEVAEKTENKWRQYCMWIITLYSKGNTTMFEYDTEAGAKEAFRKMEGCKILSQIVYYNDECFSDFAY